MTYSSALFDGADPTDAGLIPAQREKYAALARRMDLRPGHKVLEIGCGWGGFAEFAAGEIGAEVTAITISREQHAFASERIQRAGLNDRVEIRLQDYREVEGRFDRIASIEMFEAVGEAYWPQFFATLRDRLEVGGSAALQIITIADQYFEEYRRKADYIQKYIFPGGMLPSHAALAGQIRKRRAAAGRGGQLRRGLRPYPAAVERPVPGGLAGRSASSASTPVSNACGNSISCTAPRASQSVPSTWFSSP